MKHFLLLNMLTLCSMTMMACGDKITDEDEDGVAAEDDCDDNDATLHAIADDADCDGSESWLDCDDNDVNSTLIADDADCDGILTADDCDDADETSTAIADDADCDGAATADDFRLLSVGQVQTKRGEEL